MANKYTERKSSEQRKQNPNTLLLKIMQQEYPDDLLFGMGFLAQKEQHKTSFPVESNPPLPEVERSDTGVLKIVAKYQHKMKDGLVMSGRADHEGSKPDTEELVKEYTKYSLDKTIPTVDEDELDELIDEEWEYFEDPDDEPPIVIVEGGQTGLFIANRNFALRDIHDLYIQEGPEKILEFDESSTDQITDVFCVFYTVDGIAYPIPNYKTLEVMLVEAGLTYNSLRVADEDQFIQFDLKFDGDEETDQSAVEEFRERLGYGAVIDRTADWTTEVRFRSEYEIRDPFKRDPGDYIKPLDLRGQNISETTLGPRIDLYQQEDLEDMYFDQAFMGQTTREKFREQYEGKMILLDWPKKVLSGWGEDQASRGTDVKYDDAVWGLRMMINGHWKQVTEPFVMRLYAELNDQYLDSKGNLALTQYEEDWGRYGKWGYLNLLVEAGAVTVVQAAGDTTIISDDGEDDPLWSLFSHIVEADGSEEFKDPDTAAAAGVRPDGIKGLDKREYVEYLDNYTNGGKMFEVPHLLKYEPKGSIAYYDTEQYKSLIREAIVQGEIDKVKDDILELFPSVAALVQETRALFNTLPTNYNQYVTNMLGGAGPLYQVMRSKDPWKYVKKKRKKLKTKDDRHNIFKLYMKNGRMRRNLSESEENKIVSNGGRHWMRTISRDKFNDNLVKYSKIVATTSPLFLLNPVVSMGMVTTYGVASLINKLRGSVAHNKTNKLPPWRYMDGDAYLYDCIAREVYETIEEMYNRSLEIDENWEVIVTYIDQAEEIIYQFDKDFTRADSIEDFIALYDSLEEVENTIRNPEVLDLIDRADQLRKDVDGNLKKYLMNQFKALQHMRSRCYNGQGRRKKFGIAWPKSVQKIYRKYCYDQSVNFSTYNPG